MERWSTPCSHALFCCMETKVYLNPARATSLDDIWSRLRFKQTAERLLLWCPLLSLLFFLGDVVPTRAFEIHRVGTAMRRELSLSVANSFTVSSAVGSLWLTFWHSYYPYQPGYCLAGRVFAQASRAATFSARRFLNAAVALAT